MRGHMRIRLLVKSHAPLNDTEAANMEPRDRVMDFVSHGQARVVHMFLQTHETRGQRMMVGTSGAGTKRPFQSLTRTSSATRVLPMRVMRPSAGRTGPRAECRNLYLIPTVQLMPVDSLICQSNKKRRATSRSRTKGMRTVVANKE